MINSKKICWLLVTRGILQEWTLEPILFNVFITELDRVLEFVSALVICSRSRCLTAGLVASSMPVQPRVTSETWEEEALKFAVEGLHLGPALPAACLVLRSHTCR